MLPTIGAAHASGTNGTASAAAKKQHSADSGSSLLHRAGIQMDLPMKGFANRDDQFASFQLDAPSCDNCGAITVRNGNCYLCHNCGNSMGCS